MLSTLTLSMLAVCFDLRERCSCAERVPTYHIADPDCLVSADEVRHRPVGTPSTTASREQSTSGWLPTSGSLSVGLTAGASTPNNIVGQVIEKLAQFAAQTGPGTGPV